MVSYWLIWLPFEMRGFCGWGLPITVFFSVCRVTWNLVGALKSRSNKWMNEWMKDKWNSVSEQAAVESVEGGLSGSQTACSVLGQTSLPWWWRVGSHPVSRWPRPACLLAALQDRASACFRPKSLIVEPALLPARSRSSCTFCVSAILESWSELRLNRWRDAYCLSSVVWAFEFSAVSTASRPVQTLGTEIIGMILTITPLNSHWNILMDKKDSHVGKPYFKLGKCDESLISLIIEYDLRAKVNTVDTGR